MKNQNHLWHPNTQMSEWTKFPKIVRGEGMWLIDENGNRLLDGETDYEVEFGYDEETGEYTCEPCLESEKEDE